VLAEIAASVRGGVRDAETALERVLPLAREAKGGFDLAAYRTLVARVGLDATIAVVESLLAGDAKAGLHFARQLQQVGTDEREALGELVEVLRWLLLLKVDGVDTGLVPVSGALRERLTALAAAAEPHRLDAMIAAGLLGRERLRRLEDRGVVFEVALVRMAQAGALPTLADLLAEVRAGGGVATAANVAPRASAAGGTGPSRPTPAAARSAPPAPPAAPPAGAPAVAGGTELRARILAAVQDRALLHATLEQCRFDGPANGRVVVTLQTDRKMYRDRLASPVVQQEVTTSIQQVVGSAVQVEWRLGEPGPAGPSQAPPQKLEPGPTAQRVLGAFRGRVVQVDPPDRLTPAPAAPPPPPADDEGAPVGEAPPDPVE
jgi:DNA polymerase III gamma/tau subunit